MEETEEFEIDWSDLPTWIEMASERFQERLDEVAFLRENINEDNWWPSLLAQIEADAAKISETDVWREFLGGPVVVEREAEDSWRITSGGDNAVDIRVAANGNALAVVLREAETEKYFSIESRYEVMADGRHVYLCDQGCQNSRFGRSSARIPDDASRVILEPIVKNIFKRLELRIGTTTI